jgi:hypothetical protein
MYQLRNTLKVWSCLLLISQYCAFGQTHTRIRKGKTTGIQPTSHKASLASDGMEWGRHFENVEDEDVAFMARVLATDLSSMSMSMSMSMPSAPSPSPTPAPMPSEPTQPTEPPVSSPSTPSEPTQPTEPPVSSPSAPSEPTAPTTPAPTAEESPTAPSAPSPAPVSSTTDPETTSAPTAGASDPDATSPPIAAGAYSTWKSMKISVITGGLMTLWIFG